MLPGAEGMQRYVPKFGKMFGLGRSVLPSALGKEINDVHR